LIGQPLHLLSPEQLRAYTTRLRQLAASPPAVGKALRDENKPASDKTAKEVVSKEKVNALANLY
jgi:hypothetical protein